VRLNRDLRYINPTHQNETLAVSLVCNVIKV